MAASALQTIEKRFLTLKSSYGDVFELYESISIKSLTIKKMVEDGRVIGIIPLFKVSTEILATIIKYRKMHHLTSNQKETNNYDKGFVDTSFKTLFNVLSAENFLDIKGLLDLGVQAVGDRIKHKSLRLFKRYLILLVISHHRRK
ncbi:SKP1-like protein 11 [Lycium barbarum]|uniref:SKP1-like protein 11 n=1 Tax=Lycium barbarum TaxID=112863 RepID=UPI00293EE1AC|nr:SKP1-like protein 11 [Lycium barbarum]